MGAAYLCGLCGIENATIDNSASYIQSWLKKLKDDNKFVIQAASHAQRAVDYILEHQQNPFKNSIAEPESKGDKVSPYSF
jgi:antirestriction protein ArdC